MMKNISLLLFLALVFLVGAACNNRENSAPHTIFLTPDTKPVIENTDASKNNDVVEVGDRVSVDYTGTLENGTEFDSSIGKKPLTFTVGSGRMIKGFDQAVRGLRTGEEITAILEPKDGYGEKREDLIANVPLDQLPADISVGDEGRMGGRPATIIAINETVARIDSNHRLAGKTLTFHIKVISIEKEASD
ncbi:MAG: peptidylprolyl isomerase [SAR202 cluster bacterium]|nr:peptidylprolyl isomerase [SAR202 cluster bacterium]|tara:strand:- start:1448 stop:2020 length:573 start_codon:yes stop_codon:yes gene_type:complete